MKSSLYQKPLPFQTREASILSKGQSRSSPFLSSLPIVCVRHDHQEILALKSQNCAIVIYGLSTLREKYRISTLDGVRNPQSMELCNDGEHVIILCDQYFCKLLLNFKQRKCEVVWTRHHYHPGITYSMFQHGNLMYCHCRNVGSHVESMGTLNLNDGVFQSGCDDIRVEEKGAIIQKSKKNPLEDIIVYSKRITVVSKRGKKSFNLEKALINGYYNCVVNGVLAMTQDDEGRIYLLLDWLNLSNAIRGGFTTSSYLLVSVSNAFSDSSIEEEGNLICCEERSHLFNRFTFKMEFFKYEKKKYLCFFKNELDLVTVTYHEINNGYHLFKSFIYPYVDMIIICGH